MKEIVCQILFEHYNDSYQINQAKIKQRDRLFAYLLVVLVLLLFEIYSPENASAILLQTISIKLGLNTPIDFAFLGTIIWFLLLCLLIRYLQTVVAIERGYSYIHDLENEISNFINQKKFCREGYAYLDDYPLFLNWASSLFKIVFPVILLFIASYKIYIEISSFKKSVTFLAILDFIFYLAIVISLIICFIFSKKNKEIKNHRGLK
ncbi:MAG: hypothetical protein M1429_04070 [Patescibacteria group bacterium]|nr:hypothetical protein [Patescibacteria group bacterium]